jgi:KDO2-lipid IV(A) lauroyltransferase
VRPIRKFFPKPLRDFLLGLAAKTGFALGRTIPRGVGLALFSFLGTLCYYILSSDRKITVNNLRFVFGQEWNEKKIRATAKAVFRSLGKNIFDAVNLNTMSEKRFCDTVSHDSLDCVDAAKSRGKGIVFITAHAGCFEMLLPFFARKGYNCIAVGRQFKNRALDEVVRRMRNGPGMVYMDRSENSRKLVRTLQQGNIMGVLIDQDTKVDGVFADFLGHAAFTPSGAVRFAMKFDIPILIALTARLKGDKHHVFVNPEIARADTGDFDADLARNVQLINGIISSYIRKFPEQWVWMHERWKTRPEAVNK